MHNSDISVYIDWGETPLLPAIAQEAGSNEVLMLAYMDEEAFELTCNSGYAHYFSRSKQRIWKKGESSGNVQKIQSVYLDCDNDTILIKVEQVGGAACHTGRKSCFFTRVDAQEPKTEKIVSTDNYPICDQLYHTIIDRKSADPKSSYVSSLFHKGENSILKKVVEEAGELCFAVKDSDEEEIIYEAADLLFHSLVALAHKDINPDRVKQELERRMGLSGIEEKNSRR